MITYIISKDTVKLSNYYAGGCKIWQYNCIVSQSPIRNSRSGTVQYNFFTPVLFKKKEILLPVQKENPKTTGRPTTVFTSDHPQRKSRIGSS